MSERAINNKNRNDGFFSRYVVYILSILLLIGFAFVFWVSYQKNHSINQEIAVYEASQFASSVSRFRTFYSQQFVPRAQHSGIAITHDYDESDDALPLPATMLMDFGKFLEQGQDSNYTVRLYSDQPFPWREGKDGGPRDDFEWWALKELRQNPDKAVWRFEAQDEQMVLRYARADRLGESCVSCHNTYLGTPKNDWKVGDVRGVLTVSRPISGFEKATEKAMMESFVMLLMLGIAMLLLLMLALRGLRASLKVSRESVESAKIANQRLLMGIEEREQLAQDLKASQIKIRTIVDSVLDAIIVINSEGIIIEANEAVSTVLGYEPEELLGENVKILMGGDHAGNHDYYMEKYLKTGESNIIGRPRQLTARRKGGQLFPIDLSINEARFEDSVVFTGIIRDIGHRIKVQEELANARDAALESARLKSEFLANMSHEIRTPMNGVIGMTELLLDSELDREQLDQVRTVQNSAESLLRIINDILDFSKIEAGKLTISNAVCDILLVIEGVMDLLAESAHAKGIELAFFIEKDVPTVVMSDPLRLRQILINLLNNAIKFTERGHVILKVINATKRTVKEKERHLLRFEVIDTGCGISETEQARLFSAFSQVDGSVTRQYGGTGLGLAISKQLAQLMEGDIGLESRLGEGACFWVTIKAEVIACDHCQVEPCVTSALMMASKPLLSDYYENQIRQWGMEPVMVDTLNNLLLTLEENNAYDVVVLDADTFYHKPDHPLGALPVLRVLREQTRALLIICATGKQMAILETVDLGRHVHLIAKPIKHSLIRRYLMRKSSPSAPVKEAGYVTDADDENDNTCTDLTQVVLPSVNKAAVRILLTEDHKVNQRVALAMLKKLGYINVDCAVNGKEALQAVQQKNYDFVLMDCQMPVMDGYEATHQIRQLEDEHFQELPIIALTAHTMKGDDEKCYAAGMNDYLSKPVRLEELQQKLDKWLRTKQKQSVEAV